MKSVRVNVCWNVYHVVEVEVPDDLSNEEIVKYASAEAITNVGDYIDAEADDIIVMDIIDNETEVAYQ